MTAMTHGRPAILPGPSLYWWVSDAWVITLRNLRRIPRQPELLFFSAIQPVMFIVLFRYVFGGAIGQSVPGGDYAQFLMPGIFVQTVLFGSVAASAIGVAEDMSKGVMDRFRSLPMSRTSVLLGRAIADTVRNLFTTLIMVVVGMLVGFRFEGSAIAAVGGIALLLAFGFAFSWLATLIGLSVGSAEVAQTAGTVWLFPLTFASSAFTPVATMPGWLQAFAKHNPVSVTVDVLRALFNGTALGSSGWQSAAWTVGVLLVFLPLSVARFRRVSTK
jgi:ABC-2 type transport system permease protein/oleandomycin transport system permease protein